MKAADKARSVVITHRDLKPGNVMPTEAGAARQGSPRSKLLDFGLGRVAKLPKRLFGFPEEGKVEPQRVERLRAHDI